MYFFSLGYHMLFSLLLHVKIKLFLSLRTTQRKYGGIILALDGCLTPGEIVCSNHWIGRRLGGSQSQSGYSKEDKIQCIFQKLKPDCSACIQSLYWLSYPDPNFSQIQTALPLLQSRLETFYCTSFSLGITYKIHVWMICIQNKIIISRKAFIIHIYGLHH
jgi:hypothetical protein